MRPARKAPPRGVGFVGLMLTLVIVFALVACVELTRTLVAAQAIDHQVTDITGSVKGANKNLNTGCDGTRDCTNVLPVLSQTATIVAQIDKAATPLTGELDQVVTAVHDINATSAQILTTAGSINSTVRSIHNVAGGINTSVNAIGASVNGISTTASAIRVGAAGINTRADTVIGLVNGIKGDTGAINSQAGVILAQAHAISCDKVLGLAGPLSTTC